jgi:hypothetical protein
MNNISFFYRKQSYFYRCKGIASYLFSFLLLGDGLKQTKKKRKLSDSVPTEDKPVEEDDAVEVDDSSEEEEEEEEKIL